MWASSLREEARTEAGPGGPETADEATVKARGPRSKGEPETYINRGHTSKGRGSGQARTQNHRAKRLLR